MDERLQPKERSLWQTRMGQRYCHGGHADGARDRLADRTHVEGAAALIVVLEIAIRVTVC